MVSVHAIKNVELGACKHLRREDKSPATFRSGARQSLLCPAKRASVTYDLCEPLVRACNPLLTI